MPTAEIAIVWTFAVLVAAAITFVGFPAARLTKTRGGSVGSATSAPLKHVLRVIRVFFLFFFLFLVVIIFINLVVGQPVKLPPQ